jgi:hypothetical protein
MHPVVAEPESLFSIHVVGFIPIQQKQSQKVKQVYNIKVINVSV